MKNSYRLYTDLKLGIVSFAPGLLEIDTCLALNNAYKNDKDFSKIEYMVVVLLGTVPNFEHDKISLLIKEFSGFTQENNHKKRVFVVDGNLLTAFTYIFQDKIPGNSDFCTSLEKAYQIVQCTLPFQNFVDLIEQ